MTYTRDSLIKWLMENHSKDEVLVSLLWTRSDVRSAVSTLMESKSITRELTDAECDEVLHRIGRQHDCSIGVTWQVVMDTSVDVAREAGKTRKTK